MRCRDAICRLRAKDKSGQISTGWAAQNSCWRDFLRQARSTVVALRPTNATACKITLLCRPNILVSVRWENVKASMSVLFPTKLVYLNKWFSTGDRDTKRDREPFLMG